MHDFYTLYVHSGRDINYFASKSLNRITIFSTLNVCIVFGPLASRYVHIFPKRRYLSLTFTECTFFTVVDRTSTDGEAINYCSY